MQKKSLGLCYEKALNRVFTADDKIKEKIASMKNCPVCYRSLPETHAEKKSVCSTCGWAQQAKKNKNNAPKTLPYQALSTEELAREALKKERVPFLPFLLMGIAGLLILIIFAVQQQSVSTAPAPTPIPIFDSSSP
jgi:ribosomal protein L37E